MKIESLQTGMRVWDVGRRKMGNTTLSTVCVWPVDIILVDIEGRKVTARWNGNAPRVAREHEWKKWRLTEPVTVRLPMGRCRLATREELKAKRAANTSSEGAS